MKIQKVISHFLSPNIEGGRGGGNKKCHEGNYFLNDHNAQITILVEDLDCLERA